MVDPTNTENRSIVQVSRRTFVGLILGAVGSLVAACRSGTVAPGPTQTSAPLPSATPTPVPPATVQTFVSPSPAASASPTASLTPSPTATAVSTTLPPTTVSLPIDTPPLPTYTPVPATATSPPPPPATLAPTQGRAELMAHWPAVKTSRVVLVRHSGVWVNGVPEPAIVLQMLDQGLGTLTGVSDVLSVWRTLFDPEERVLLKVNCISYGGPTQPAVTLAVARRLQDAGLRAENILIFDRTDDELAAAGYSLNEGGPGVQCHGARGRGSEAALTQAKVRFFQEIDACQALINLPIPKQHGISGISVSLKNHYGSVSQPGALHGNWCDPALAELNAQPTIRDKTRLVVGAALNVGSRDWNRPEREDALLLSFDPVALDTVARDILVRRRQAQGLDVGFLLDGARHLGTAQSLNLGATEVDLIDLREVTLG